MKTDWPLRQLLAVLRGVAIMLALFWVLILMQLLPALFRGGLAGIHDHITRVAIAGVPPERWDQAVTRMYESLGATLLAGCLFFVAQRYLGRWLASHKSARGSA